MDPDAKEFETLVPAGLNEALTVGVTDTRWFAPKPIFHSVVATIITFPLGWYASTVWNQPQVREVQEIGVCIDNRKDFYREFLVRKL